jgi:anti-anti-sigma factor
MPNNLAPEDFRTIQVGAKDAHVFDLHSSGKAGTGRKGHGDKRRLLSWRDSGCGEGADRQQQRQGAWRQAHELLESGRTRLLIYLHQVEYISSAGFRILLVANQLAEQAQGALSLCELSPQVQRLFTLAAFTDLFEIHPSRPKAAAC